jgi:hypothetical protein
LTRDTIRAAISARVDWQPAIDTDADLRDGAEIAEITHLLDLSSRVVLGPGIGALVGVYPDRVRVAPGQLRGQSAYPTGTRAIVRRERPHPGAQLSLFDTIEGLRRQVFITDTPRPGLLGAAARGAPPRPLDGARPPHSSQETCC